MSLKKLIGIIIGDKPKLDVEKLKTTKELRNISSFYPIVNGNNIY